MIKSRTNSFDVSDIFLLYFGIFTQTYYIMAATVVGQHPISKQLFYVVFLLSTVFFFTHT